MGLAASQIQLLTYTGRKADCELSISIDAMHKVNMAKEMAELTQQYNSMLGAKVVGYFADGQFNKMNYGYLMGYPRNFSAMAFGNKQPLKDNTAMILTDYRGKVVMSDVYANAIRKVCGVDEGGSFPEDKIYDILAELFPGRTAAEFRDGIQSLTWTASVNNIVTGNNVGTVVKNTANLANDGIERILTFYYPIFQAASINGWTTEYNPYMQDNDNYISDSIATGTFMLMEVNEFGHYQEDYSSLTYHITTGDVDYRGDADQRKVLTEWYNAEKERIAADEELIDQDMTSLSTELEAIKAEIASIETYIKDAVDSVFSWGGNGP